jgi:hypothetical protein
VSDNDNAEQYDEPLRNVQKHIRALYIRMCLCAPAFARTRVRVDVRTHSVEKNCVVFVSFFSEKYLSTLWYFAFMPPSCAYNGEGGRIHACRAA